MGGVLETNVTASFNGCQAALPATCAARRRLHHHISSLAGKTPSMVRRLLRLESARSTPSLSTAAGVRYDHLRVKKKKKKKKKNKKKKNSKKKKRKGKKKKAT